VSSSATAATAWPLEVDRVVADLDAQEAAPSPTLPGLDPDFADDDIL
jgi:hypothetical protein